MPVMLWLTVAFWKIRPFCSVSRWLVAAKNAIR